MVVLCGSRYKWRRIELSYLSEPERKPLHASLMCGFVNTVLFFPPLEQMMWQFFSSSSAASWSAVDVAWDTLSRIHHTFVGKPRLCVQGTLLSEANPSHACFRSVWTMPLWGRQLIWIELKEDFTMSSTERDSSSANSTEAKKTDLRVNEKKCCK